MCETVATMTQSTCAASMPAPSSALRAAETDIICTVSSGPAKRRSLIPDRCWIHSSLESIASISSELGTTRLGRYDPMPRIAAWLLPGAEVSVVMR